MLGKLMAPEFAEMIDEKRLDDLREVLSDMPIGDAAEVLEELDPDQSAVLFRILQRDRAGELFAALPLEEQTELLHALGHQNVADILDAMPPDDRTRLLEELPGPATQQLLSELSPDERAIAQRLLGYPEQTIGRLMTPEYIMVREDWTVDQALRHVRERAASSETANVVYVVDAHLKLIDDIKLSQLVLAKPDATLSDLMDYAYVALRAHEHRESAVQVFRKYYRQALPVTDSDGVLVGMVTLDDVLNVALEEATEDIQKMGGVSALDEPYVSAPFWHLISKRAGWLLILLLGGMLTATAMKAYEGELEKAVVLGVFLPLIISSGGNSGSQGTSLIIRALAVGELTPSSWLFVLKREVRVGIVLGIILGIVGMLRVLIWSIWSTDYGEHYFLLSLTLCVSLIGITLMGNLVGAMLPFILKRVGLDPAVSSAPFVATLVDVSGIVIYFTVASYILAGTIL